MDPTTTIVVAGVTVLLIVVAMFIGWIRWKPRRKKWCAVFYMVGRLPRTLVPVNWPDPQTGKPAGAKLDLKLDQVIEAISTLPCSSYQGVTAEPIWEKDVHVVYRALWDDPELKPRAKVVSWRPFAPKADYFPGELLDPTTKDLTDDLKHYFLWLYDKCPADHYAVFFWGHSMGPGGLFEVREEPFVPSPADPLPPPVISANIGLAELETAFVTFIDALGKDAPQTLEPLSRLSAADVTTAEDETEATDEDDETTGVTPLPLKVDVVLFQDCWMATLETAFQLQDTVRYVVSSQSLVPIGYTANGSLGAVWPYKELIVNLLTKPHVSSSLIDVLERFFNGTLPPVPPTPNYNRFPNPILPFSLLDLGAQKGQVSAALSLPLQQLVSALNPLGSGGRAGLIEGAADATVGQLFKLDTTPSHDLQVGEAALLDVLTLCRYLENSTLWHPSVSGPLSVPEKTAIKHAAKAVRRALETLPLVRDSFESHDAVQLPLGFTGISVLWKPTVAPAGDPFLTNQVPGDHYDELRFALDTTVSGTVPARNWKTYAFEQHP